MRLPLQVLSHRSTPAGRRLVTRPKHITWATVLLLVCTPCPLQAQPAGANLEGLRASGYSVRSFIPPFPEGAAKSTFPETAVFEIEFGESIPEEAREAFRYATAIWGSHIRSIEPIRVSVEWAELEEDMLGTASPMRQPFPGSPYPNVWYPTALANAILGRDLASPSQDMRVRFNTRSDWYFGVDGATPPDQYDFVTVALHEIGHGLGLLSSFAIDDGNAEPRDECPGVPRDWGCWGHASFGTTEPLPLVFDLFAADALEVNLVTAYANPSLELAAVFQSGQVFFDGPFSTPANGGHPVSLYAPAVFEAGASVSHLDEATYPTPEGGSADPNALMTPSLAAGEAVHSPGALTCAMLEDIGWEMSAGCAALRGQAVAVEELPPASPYTLKAFYPNPAGGIARATLHVQVSQNIRIEVYNVAGQRVATMPDRLAVASQSTLIEVDTAGWAHGVYFVRILGDTFTAVESLVHSGP